MTGWNLPPGCEDWNIPGNRPEDIEAEKVCEQCEYFPKCEDDPQRCDYCPLERAEQGD